MDFDTRTATAMVAEELVRMGMFEDAIKLYDLANVSINQAIIITSIKHIFIVAIHH